jgi:hypothetical protein
MTYIKSAALAAAALALLAVSAQAQYSPRSGVQAQTNQYDPNSPAPFSREAQERFTW